MILSDTFSTVGKRLSHLEPTSFTQLSSTQVKSHSNDLPTWFPQIMICSLHHAYVLASENFQIVAGSMNSSRIVAVCRKALSIFFRSTKLNEATIIIWAGLHRKRFHISEGILLHTLHVWISFLWDHNFHRFLAYISNKTLACNEH